MPQIFVDARDKTSGTPANFTITLPQTLTLGSGHQGRIDDLRLPITTPTIYDGNNGITVSVEGGPEQTVYISVGNYPSGTSLAFAVQNALSGQPGIPGISGSWTVNYDVNTTYMSVVHDKAFVFTGGTYMRRMLDRPYTRDAEGKVYRFMYVPLQGLDMMYLCSSTFSSLDAVGPKGASDCLCAIPITVGFGSVQAYSMSLSVFVNIPALTTQSLSFQLRDRDHNLLHVIPNVAFTLTID
jgi:hypothetical protein